MSAALAYAKMGWRVLPLFGIENGVCSCLKGTDCDSPGKHPRNKGGLKNATTDDAQLRTWWRWWPDANVGIATGAESGFFAVDIDPGFPSGEESLLAIGKGAPMPDTVEAVTGGGGRHILFKHPGGMVKTRAPAFGPDYPNLDIRGDGGYIVVYPSLHVSGRRYEWDAAGDPLEGKALADAPFWIINPFEDASPPAAAPGAKPTPAAAEAPPTGRPPSVGEYTSGPRLHELDTPIGEGQRDQELFRIACSLRGLGLDAAAIEVQLLEINRRRCVPPLTEDQVRKCARQGAKQEANSVPRQLREEPPRERKRTSTEDLDARVTSSPEVEGYVDPSTGEQRPFQLGDVGNAERLITWFGEDLRYVAETGWCVWDDDRWRKGAEGILAAKRVAMRVAERVLLGAAHEENDGKRKEMLSLGGKLLSKRTIDAMLSMGTAFPQIEAKLSDFDSDPLLVGTLNGTLDLRTGILRPPNPADMITMRCGCRYEAAEAPRFIQFVKEIMLGREDLMQFLMLSLGYSLSGLMTPATFWFAIGTGANGKSLLTGLAQKVMGDYSTTLMPDSIMIRKNEQIPADIAKLQGKRLVVVPEVDDGRQLNLPLLKALSSSEEKITARFLNANFVDFYSTSKLWITGNQKPQVRNFDNALRRRLRVLPFDLQLDESQKDEDLGEKLWDEASGVLWLMAQAFQAFYKARALPTVSIIEEATDEYRREADMIGQFLEEETEECGEEYPRLAKNKLRERYMTWCRTNGVPSEKRNTFYDKVRAHGVRMATTKTDGDYPFMNIRLRESQSTDRRGFDE